MQFQILPLHFTEPKKTMFPSRKNTYPENSYSYKAWLFSTWKYIYGLIYLRTNKQKTRLLTKWKRQKEKEKKIKNDAPSTLSHVLAVADPSRRARCMPFPLLQVGEPRSERHKSPWTIFFPFHCSLFSSLSYCTLSLYSDVLMLLSLMQQYMNQIQRSHNGKFFINRLAMAYPCIKQGRLTR